MTPMTSTERKIKFEKVDVHDEIEEVEKNGYVLSYYETANSNFRLFTLTTSKECRFDLRGVLDNLFFNEFRDTSSRTLRISQKTLLILADRNGWRINGNKEWGITDDGFIMDDETRKIQYPTGDCEIDIEIYKPFILEDKAVGQKIPLRGLYFIDEEDVLDIATDPKNSGSVHFLQWLQQGVIPRAKAHYNEVAENGFAIRKRYW